MGAAIRFGSPRHCSCLALEARTTFLLCFEGGFGVEGGVGRRKSHVRPVFVHWVHAGLDSSHFLCRNLEWSVSEKKVER